MLVKITKFGISSNNMTYSETAYEDLLEEISKVHPTVQTSGFGGDAFKPGLEGMRRFDNSLGNPWRKFRTIHVAGTNGKGSVCSMLAAALAASGLKVGLYTSPHLVDFRERIKIIGVSSADRIRPSCQKTFAPLRLTSPRVDTVSDRRVSYFAATVIPRTEVFEFLTENDLSGLSYFEITTGMAFWWFARQKVDAAVIEVGLGGRFDSTNIITPELSVITSIGLDHCAILGGTRAEIAYEKAGIFKHGVPALVWGHDAETDAVFEKCAFEIGCPLHFADEADTGLTGAEFEETLNGLDLQGPCQEINLQTVLAALALVRENPHFLARNDVESAFRAQITGISRTAEITDFRGRWEKLLERPEVICDIGHNPPALKINFRRLTELHRPLYIVYGIMADKDLDGIAPLMPAAERFFLVAPSISRSLPAGELGHRLGDLRPELKQTVSPSVEAGVREALSRAAMTPDSLVYIGGSTFVVSEAITSVFSGHKE